MHRSEAEQLTRCADCGAEIEPGAGRTYACDADTEVCFACAVRRGGVYDEARDRWSRAPDVADLLEADRECEHALPG